MSKEEVTSDMALEMVNEECIGDISDSHTQCCFCCSDLSNVFESIQQNEENFCRVGCLGYLNITCSVLSNSGEEDEEDNLRFCSYGETFASGEQIAIQDKVVECDATGTLRQAETDAPVGSPPGKPELPESDGISTDFAVVFFLGGACLVVLAMMLLAAALFLLYQNKSSKVDPSSEVGVDLVNGTGAVDNEQGSGRDYEVGAVSTAHITQKISIDEDI